MSLHWWARRLVDCDYGNAPRFSMLSEPLDFRYMGLQFPPPPRKNCDVREYI